MSLGLAPRHFNAGSRSSREERMKEFITKTIKYLHIAEDAGRIFTIVAMTILVFIQVVARIFFKWSSPAMEEAARFIMIWSIFIGAVVSTREDSHIKMGGIFKREPGVLWFELLSKVICFAFLCIFVYWSYEFVAHSLRRNMSSIVLGVPLAVVHSTFLVTGVLMAVHTLYHLFDRIGQVARYYKGARS
jgi:TRAP-type C4-dicarboxylate transport system permease small subunit